MTSVLTYVGPTKWIICWTPHYSAHCCSSPGPASGSFFSDVWPEGEFWPNVERTHLSMDILSRPHIAILEPPGYTDTSETLFKKENNILIFT